MQIKDRNWVGLIEALNANGGKTAIESRYAQIFVKKALNIGGSARAAGSRYCRLKDNFYLEICVVNVVQLNGLPF